MKRIFFLITILLPLGLFAQDPDTFIIKGKVGNFNAPTRAYLMYQYGANKIVDSAEVNNGTFDFSGKVLNPSFAYLIMDPKGVDFSKLDNSVDILSFYIDKGEFSITSPDSVAKATISGSRINDDNKKLTSQLKPVIDKAKALEVEKNAASPAQSRTAEFQNAMQEKYKALQIAQKTIIKNFILTNHDSYLSLLLLYSVGGPSPNPLELDTLYNSLSENLKNTQGAKDFESALEPLRHTAVGTMAPDFTQADVNGVPVKLSSFRGKYVLVDFWASWCGPCRQENPNVVKAYNKYKDKNFAILGVSLDRENGKADWLAAIKRDGLSWTQVSDLKFWNNEVATLYFIKSIPANFLIDPNGKIIAKDLRGGDLEDKLAEVLGK